MRKPQDELQELEQVSLMRSLRVLNTPQGASITEDGSSLLNFASNDYLGLTTHPEIIDAACQGTKKWGTGAGSSRLISGTMHPHDELECTIASLKNKPAARVFANGYCSSLGLLSGIMRKGDVILLDKLAHASLIDGAKLSAATLRVFPHNDLNKLEKLLKSNRDSLTADQRIIIVIESVYSMDGDLAPLLEITKLKEKYGALLLVDEAHALGVYGDTGMGIAHELGCTDQIDFHMGTLGKSAGTAGGYIACSQAWADLMTNKSRSFIYSTAPPPAQLCAASKALEIITSEEGSLLRAALWRNIKMLHTLLNGATTTTSAIIPLIIGDSQATLDTSHLLESKHAIRVPAVRYPTVPKNTARLRISLSAAHTTDHIQHLANSLSQALCYNV